MNVATLTTTLEARADQTILCRREHREWIVRETLLVLPYSRPADAMQGRKRDVDRARRAFGREIYNKVWQRHRDRFGFPWTILLTIALQVLVKLIIDWWFDAAANVVAANLLRDEIRG